MDDIRDDPTPAEEPPRNNDESPDSRREPEPRWSFDAAGNLEGRLFSFSSEHLVIFEDVAITDPVELAKLRKPKPGA